MYADQNRILLPGSERQLKPGSAFVRRVPDEEQIAVTLILRPEQRGAMETAIAKLHAFARQFGLTILGADKEAGTVLLTGGARQMEAGFHVDLNDYAHPEGAYRGRAGGILLPAPIFEIVSEVSGL